MNLLFSHIIYMLSTQVFEAFGLSSNLGSPTIVQKNPLWIGDRSCGMKRDGMQLITSATVGSNPTCTTKIQKFLKFFLVNLNFFKN